VCRRGGCWWRSCRRTSGGGDGWFCRSFGTAHFFTLCKRVALSTTWHGLASTRATILSFPGGEVHVPASVLGPRFWLRLWHRLLCCVRLFGLIVTTVTTDLLTILVIVTSCATRLCLCTTRATVFAFPGREINVPAIQLRIWLWLRSGHCHQAFVVTLQCLNHDRTFRSLQRTCLCSAFLCNS
jgi:hypothetical protein